MNWNDVDEYNKLNHCIKLFGDVFFPKARISDKSTSVEYAFDFVSGWPKSLYLRKIRYDKITHLFTGNYTPSYKYSKKIDSPLHFDETFTVECIETSYKYYEKITSEIYIYPLMAAIGIDHDICLFADWIYHNNRNNTSEFKYLYKMQAICDEIEKLQPYYKMNLLALIPEAYKSNSAKKSQQNENLDKYITEYNIIHRKIGNYTIT
jgi:hypothetical protein